MNASTVTTKAAKFGDWIVANRKGITTIVILTIITILFFKILTWINIAKRYMSLLFSRLP